MPTNATFIYKTLSKLTFLFLTFACFFIGTPAHATETTSEKKILIVFYSWGGNTRYVAQQIHEKIGGDIVELETVDPYPTQYRPTTVQAKKELSSGYLPPLKTKIDNLSSYDIILIGSPNWWGTFAMPVRTFLSENNLSGKTVLEFMTHGGSRLGNSVEDLHTFCPNAKILPGLAIGASQAKNSQKEIIQWLHENEIVK